MGGALRVFGSIFVIAGFFLIGGSFSGLSAQAAGGVIISEVAWMGTTNSANDEWLELYNQTSYAVDLTGWILEAADGTPKIDLAVKAVASPPIIPAGGFFLLERTNDTTVPDVAADVIYTGALSNSGEVLILKDAAGNEVDRVDASGGWPAGDNSTKETMQWTGSVWVTAEPTPRATNKSGSSSPPAPAPEPEPESSPSTPPPAPEPQPLSEPTPEPAPGSVSQPASTPSPSPQPATPSIPQSAPSSPKSPPVSPTVSSAPQISEPPLTSTDSTTTTLAAVSETLSPETGSKKFSVFWIVVIVLLVLVGGLLWVVRAQRVSSRDKNIFPE